MPKLHAPKRTGLLHTLLAHAHAALHHVAHLRGR